MKRRWKILIGIAVTLAVLLAVNAVVVDQQTEPAGITASGAQLIRLPGGEVQVLEQAAQSPKPGAPIVLLHCYACSLQWWDYLTPLLATDHRVIRVDFLGFGGSEKPSSGYSVEDQAQLVAGAMNELDVQGAVVVGQSMGAAMAVSLAESSSQLVDRVVAISLAPDNDDDQLPFLARLGYIPVLGEAIWRLTPDFAVLDSFRQAFAPGFEIPPDFEDVILDGYQRMTYTSYDQGHRAATDFRDAAPLDERMTASLVPLMAIFGADDQILDPTAAAEGFEDVPGVRISTLPGVGHTPQVEAPKETASLIKEFAADAGDELLAEHPPKQAGKKNDHPKRDDKTKRDPDKKKGKKKGEGKQG